MNHWFDGLSILTSFKIDARRGTVCMTKRFLNSEAYQKASTHGRLIVTGKVIPFRLVKYFPKVFELFK